MYFPKFKGKSYDFVIFQGSEQKTVFQDTIPEGGRFTLSIPKEYSPYKGMVRWVITGTKEGGGLDMYIPGNDFSVSCDSDKPDNTNIIYKNNSSNAELYELSKIQEKILSRYDLMLAAKNIFTSKDRHYPVFLEEYEKQKKDYELFQRLLNKRSDYISEFIRIVNITNGIGTILYTQEKEKADNIANYITENLNWESLYTSGHWWSVINGWISIHTNVLKDQMKFIKDFEIISSKLKNDDHYKDFISKVAFFLREKNNENYLKAVAPLVKSSGRINSYNGYLEEYIKY
ncbi:alkyl hydroperoxide reductase [Elizabethkingia anophelis]|uniref:alkyl hydroperoxide reductase n=1 Tax=Elizabethkingia anophelis TaxID=1117645 RepID=UPI000C6EA2D8|nr:alkyl hydroperoxide reductase [Elizabethkingia anophelis]MDV3509030.1 alkyl hydroperoxide reductase [Elizabethkingia anophelis]MDV3544663.1 alkyl hydroperoxide reductase [Elizabethkingia anophelis]PKR32811.1 alkyl hydroperoxide reductase [Elizabethkingia anophelis]PKR35521.1 alkyl hydroperoxide reductase [Elizabethkingia anophelis]PRQ78251.1 alkyl hydroperoxide reductase [Elizabethkingia anophelis]